MLVFYPLYRLLQVIIDHIVSGYLSAVDIDARERVT